MGHALPDVIENGARIVVHEYDVDRPAHVAGRGQEVSIDPDGQALMTRAGLAALLAAADVTDVDLDEAMVDEHLRSSAYRKVIAVVAEGPRGDLDEIVVRAFLRDPVNVVAKSAVVAFIDAVAPTTSGPSEFECWAASLASELDHLSTPTERDFVRLRVHDWTVYLAIAVGNIPTASDLAAITNRMQHLLAGESTSPAVLTMLAEAGNSRKIRNTAKNRAGSRALQDEP